MLLITTTTYTLAGKRPRLNHGVSRQPKKLASSHQVRATQVSFLRIGLFGVSGVADQL